MQEQPEAAPEEAANNTVNEAVDAVTSMDPNTILEFMKNNGIDSSLFVNFGKNLIIAILIFYIGRFVVNLVVRGLTRVMARQQVVRQLVVVQTLTAFFPGTFDQLDSRLISLRLQT